MADPERSDAAPPPNDAEEFCRRAAARFEAGRYDEALADLDAALRLDRACSTALVWRGIVLFHQSDFERAAADFSEAVRLDPRCAWAWAWRGGVRARQDQLEQALADFDQAVRLEPDNASHRLNRGAALHRIGDRDAAIADFNDGGRPQGAPRNGAAHRVLRRRARRVDRDLRCSNSGAAETEEKSHDEDRVQPGRGTIGGVAVRPGLTPY